MKTFQESIHCKPSISTAVGHTSTIGSVGNRSNCSPPSAAETGLPEPLKTEEGDRASVQHLGLLAKRQLPRIAVRARGKVFFMEIADIAAVHAERNYASIEYRSSSYVVRESLCSIAVKLQPYGFIQIHRSVLVNTSLVAEIQLLVRGDYRLSIRNGTEYIVTCRYRDNLRHLAHVWLGSKCFWISTRAFEDAHR